MKKYKYHSAIAGETAWIESPNGDKVGDLMEITAELNLLQKHWAEKCLEADTMRQHHSNAEAVLDRLVRELKAMVKKWGTSPCGGGGGLDYYAQGKSAAEARMRKEIRRLLEDFDSANVRDERHSPENIQP